MLANNFNYVRDIFYLSAIFLGLALGLLARCKIKIPAAERRGIFVLPESCTSGLIPSVTPQSGGVLNPTARIKNLRASAQTNSIIVRPHKSSVLITAAICSATVFAALLCPVIIISKGYFIFERSLLIVFFIVCVVSAAATIFPIPFGFPLIVVLGFATVSSVYYFFRYPSFESITENGKYVSILKIQLSDTARVEFADNILAIGVRHLHTSDSKRNVQTYNINASSISVDYEINTIRTNRAFPVIGNRVFVVPLTVSLIDKDAFKLRILPGNKSQKSLFNNMMYFRGKLISIKNYSGEVALEKIAAPHPTQYELFFTGDSLEAVR
ncbi:MAG: hypothetical protein Ta2B_29170 [Termitinemataceae bacterium]|nr:MAG: hypothetical protein Ta2B_29170 [Termitinemataceae bacterium]